MRDLGLEVLVGREHAPALRDALNAMAYVRWDRVDPAASTRPVRNRFGAPVYAGGDSVPYERRVGLCVVPALRRYSGEAPVSRGAVMGGDLTSGRTFKGTGIAPGEFFASGGIRVMGLRIGKPGKWQEDAHADLLRFDPRTRHIADALYPKGPHRGLPEHTRSFRARLPDGGVEWHRRVRRRGAGGGAGTRGDGTLVAGATPRWLEGVVVTPAAEPPPLTVESEEGAAVVPPTDNAVPGGVAAAAVGVAGHEVAPVVPPANAGDAVADAAPEAEQVVGSADSASAVGGEGGAASEGDGANAEVVAPLDRNEVAALIAGNLAGMLEDLSLENNVRLAEHPAEVQRAIGRLFKISLEPRGGAAPQ